MTDKYDVLIVGAGQAGAQAASALRQGGYQGSIALVGDESSLPYSRPQLSKEYLSGTIPFEKLLLRTLNYWNDYRIKLLLGKRVVRVEPVDNVVFLDDGKKLTFDTLIWATGGDARRLTCPGHDLHGVHVIRKLQDVDNLRAELPNVRKVAVIGGGYVGLETSAALTRMGKQVTLLESQNRLLNRVTGGIVSDFFASEHKRAGVDIRLGVTVKQLEEMDGRIHGIKLSSGELVKCDLVIVGIGLSPCVDQLLKAGAEGENGVLVDEYCRTTLPNIYAIGDCAQHRNRYANNREIRLESIQNANDMAMTVVNQILGKARPYDAIPWFWSQQYDVKLQTIGLSAGYDTELVTGNVSESSFSVAYLKEGQTIAVDCINSPRDFIQAKKTLALSHKLSSEESTASISSNL